MRILAIDPGNIESGYCVLNGYKPIEVNKVRNERIENVLFLLDYFDRCKTVVIEMVESYGMPVGREVFDTVRWIGKFEAYAEKHGMKVEFVTRKEEKLTICNSMKANDSTIRQALVDRFAPGTPNHGKGTKKEKGFFYGFKADMWSAFAVGVTYLDRKKIDFLE